MNNLYFFCEPCKVFVDAGYRWASYTLEETAIVRQNEAIDPSLVLAADEYWNPEVDEHTRWLVHEVLPSVRSFLSEHFTHKIVFGEDYIYFDASEDWFLEWIQEGFLARLLARTLHERLKLKSWLAVSDYIKRLDSKPMWWTDQDERKRAERWYKARCIGD